MGLRPPTRDMLAYSATWEPSHGELVLPMGTPTSAFFEALEGNKKRKNIIVHVLRSSFSVQCHVFMNQFQPYARISMLCAIGMGDRVRGDSHLRFFLP